MAKSKGIRLLNQKEGSKETEKSTKGIGRRGKTTQTKLLCGGGRKKVDGHKWFLGKGGKNGHILAKKKSNCSIKCAKFTGGNEKHHPAGI